MSPVFKSGVSVGGLAMLAVSATYTAHTDAPTMAYVAAVFATVGAYLVGLFQKNPFNTT